MTMRTKRAMAQPEACGVWLDTSARRKRSVQTLISRSSFKLNNLFLKRPPSTELDYDFTQTTSPSLCTKQTTISSFFLTTHPGPASETRDFGKKRNLPLNELECSAKRSRVTGNASPQQSIEGLLDCKLLESQLCHLPLEPCESLSTGPKACLAHAVATGAPQHTGEPTISPETRSLTLSPPSAESQQSLQHAKLPLVAYPQCSLHPCSQIPFQRFESEELFQLSENLQENPDVCFSVSKLSDLDFVGQQTVRKCSDTSRTQNNAPCIKNDGCGSVTETASVGKEYAPSQIEFTQDSEGNMVISHSRKCKKPQNNGARVALLDCISANCKKPEVLYPRRPLSKCVVNAGSDPPLRILEMSENCSHALSNDTLSALKENISPLNSKKHEISFCKSKSLLHFNREEFCRSGEPTSLNNVGTSSRLTVHSYKRDSQEYLFDNNSIEIGKTSVQKPPLGDRTNKDHADKYGPKAKLFPCIAKHSGWESSSNSQLMPSLLFTQDSEGNNVIKHY